MNRRHFLKSCLAAGAMSALPGFGLAIAAPLGSVRTQTRLLMGTLVSISAVNLSKDLVDEAIGLAFERISELESIYSRYDSASALEVLNAQGYLADAPQGLQMLLSESMQLHRELNGAFDISVGPLVELMESARASGKNPGRKELAEARALADISDLSLNNSGIRLSRTGMRLTLDGIAKGAIVDEAAAKMRSAGLSDFLINAGGDIYAAGRKEPGKSWKVAIESPERNGDYPAVLELSDRAIATSGGYERPGHLVSPESGLPGNYRSVSVAAPSVKEADALATGLSFLPLPQAKAVVAARPGCSALFIDQRGQLHKAGLV